MRQAAQLAERNSVIIFSENKLCEQASTLVLLAKCDVASVRHINVLNRLKVDKYKRAIFKLENAKNLYQKLECISKVKDIVYLQVIFISFRTFVTDFFSFKF